MEPVLVKIIETEKPKSLFLQLESRLKTMASIIGSLTIIGGVALSVLSMSGTSGKETVNSVFNGAKAIFGLTKGKDPNTDDVEASVGVASGAKVVGWSYLGNTNNTDRWYFPGLVGVEQDAFVGRVEKPRTDMYVRATRMSVANPSPRAVGTIKVSGTYNQCMHILGTNYNNDTGSIWLEGEKVDCPTSGQ